MAKGEQCGLLVDSWTPEKNLFFQGVLYFDLFTPPWGAGPAVRQDTFNPCLCVVALMINVRINNFSFMSMTSCSGVQEFTNRPHFFTFVNYELFIKTHIYLIILLFELI